MYLDIPAEWSRILYLMGSFAKYDNHLNTFGILIAILFWSEEKNVEFISINSK